MPILFTRHDADGYRRPFVITNPKTPQRISRVVSRAWTSPKSFQTYPDHPKLRSRVWLPVTAVYVISTLGMPFVKPFQGFETSAALRAFSVRDLPNSNHFSALNTNQESASVFFAISDLIYRMEDKSNAVNHRQYSDEMWYRVLTNGVPACLPDSKASEHG